MAGFKNGALALKKKDIGVNADPGFIHILVDTSNNLYTIDEFGVYRSIAGYDIISSGSDISVVTSGGTKILSLNSTSVVSGTYGTSTSVPQIVVDNKGRILSAYNIPISASGLGTVTSISISSSTLKVINSPITTFGTFGVNLSATGVVSGSILRPFVDSYGRVLSGGLISATDISDRSADGLLASNSDNKIPTEQAVKTYVDLKTEIISLNFLPLSGGTLTGKIILSAVNPINIPSNSYYSFAAGDIINYSGLKGNFPSFSIINPASNTYESGASFILSNSPLLPNNKWTMQLASSGLDFWYYSGLSPIKRMGISNTTGKIEAVGYKTFTGTSAQFLKADGSVDSNSYATTSAVENYLPLSGGTLTGLLNGTNISASGSISASNEIFTSTTFRSRLYGNYASVILNSNGAWLGIGSDGSTNNTLKIGSTNGDQNFNGNANLYVTGHLTLNNAFRPNWGTGRNFTMLGGTVSIGQTYSGGDYLIMHNNSYFDGTNNRSISSTGYSSEMYIKPEGSFVFNTVANNGVNGIINYPTPRFSVDKDGRGVFVGSVSAGNAAFGTWSGNADYAWFGHYNQNNVVNGYSGILHRDDGTMVIYAPINKAIYLGINSSTVAQIINTGVDVIGNVSASNQIQATNTFKSMQSGNYASIILNANSPNWLGIGSDGSTNHNLKIGSTNGDQNWNGNANLYVTGNVSAQNFYAAGNLVWNSGNDSSVTTYGQFVDSVNVGGSYTNNKFTYVGTLPNNNTSVRESLTVKIYGGHWTDIGGCEVVFNAYGTSLKGAYKQRLNNNSVNWYAYLNGGGYDFYVLVLEDSGWGSFAIESTYYSLAGRQTIKNYFQTLSPTGTSASINFNNYNSGDIRWNSLTNNLTSYGNYYVSNYSGGGTPALITNTGNARFYTLSLVDYNSTTGGGSLLFTDANIGATGGSYFSNGGKQNAIQLKGSGDPGYGGLYFGQNNTEYIGVKGSGYLYLGSSTKVQIDSNQIQLFSTGSSTYNSTYDISISSTNGNVSLVAGSNLNTTSIYNTTIAANSQLSLTAHSNLSILCDSNVYINSTSGIIYTQATQNSKNIQNDLISVTATTAATTATNIYALPDDYNVYFLAQGTTTAYRNYRLPTPPSPKHIVLICGDSASGNLLCTIIRPSGRILYNSSGSSILSFRRGGAIPLYYDGTDWYCAVTV